MDLVKRLLSDRNVIMLLGLIVGLSWSGAVSLTEPLTLPVLALVMTLSTMGISGTLFRPVSNVLTPAFAGMLMSYAVFTCVILPIAFIFVKEPALRTGFVLLAAVPPAIAVIPFTFFLKGNASFSLVGTIGAYVGGLAIMPLMTLYFIGADFFNPFKVVLVLGELIVVPLLASRIIMWTGLNRRLEPVRGTIINWSFFLFNYTVVALNREVFLHKPRYVIPLFLIAAASMFLLGWAIEKAGDLMRIDRGTRTSLVLLGTLKNYGIAGGVALSLFSKEATMPSTVSAIVMIIYIVWLQYRGRSASVSAV